MGPFFGLVRDIFVGCSQSTFSQEIEHPPLPTMLCRVGLEEESQDTVCEVVKFSSETNLCEVHPRDVLAIYVAQPPNIDVERKGFQANIPQA